MTTKREKSGDLIVITNFPATSNWIDGSAGQYKFSAKVFDNGSVYGIDDGRVSKLTVYSTGGEFPFQVGNTIVNYDRGWDVRPKQEHKELFKALMKKLEATPKRFS